MTRIIAVANQKGGVGKTTTVLNLGTALRREGQRVLLVDLDPQAALSVSLKIPINQAALTIYQVLLGKATASKALRPTYIGADLIPANIDLAAAAFDDRFIKLVDPNGRLSVTERARRAGFARRAYFARLALLSAKARRR